MATHLIGHLGRGPRVRRFVNGVVYAGLALWLAGCGSNTPQETESADTPAAADASHEGHQMARVFFVEPKDGATVSSKQPVKFVFGQEGYTIAAVPEGEITEAQVRPNMGHFHLGVDKECVPAGQEIVRGQPDWVHFGTGTDNIEMSLTPGQHTFAVQVGDDLHRAVEGLCQTITINVE
jgi:hypothetical protein